MKLKFHNSKQNQKPSLVKSVVGATAILQSLGDGLVRLTDISYRTGINKATTYRLLKTLEGCGLVAQDRVTHHYHLGHLIVQLASNPFVAHQKLVICSFDEMKYLRGLSGESVGLHVSIGTQSMVLAEIPSSHSITFTTGKGYISPLHCGAGPKTLLSQFPQHELEAYINGVKLVNMRTNELIDKETLLNQLERIRNEGYAVSFGELISGSAAICVPINNYPCPAGLSIYGPEERFKDKMMGFLKDLKESAHRISSRFTQ